MTQYTQEYWEKAKANPDKYDIDRFGRIRIRPHADVFDYESYEPLKPMIKAPKHFPAQVMYVDTSKIESQSIPSNQIWMLTLPLLVLAVVLIGGRA